MLQYINDLPADVLGIHAIGEVTKQDMDAVLLPKLDELAKTKGDIKYLLVLETDVSNFSLAAWWSDLVTGLKHFTEWKRIAVVTDQKGVEWFTDVFTHFIPGKAKGFNLGELDEAVKWISANN
ncbi:MAG TPA: STAS/SEC14 domain-containing protein [Mucilaginibacter sp.]|jgi:Protein of unknown function (DUF3478).